MPHFESMPDEKAHKIGSLMTLPIKSMRRKGLSYILLLHAISIANAAPRDETQMFGVPQERYAAPVESISAHRSPDASNDNDIAVLQVSERTPNANMREPHGGVSLTLASEVRKQLSKEFFERMAQTTWIEDGSSHANRVVYVFTDLNCESCFKFWLDARPWVESKKVQLRQVLVGLRGPKSSARAAAVLEATDPTSEFLRRSDKCAMMAYRPHLPWAFRCDLPEVNATEATQAQLQLNMRVLRQLDFTALPALVWIDRDGDLRKQIGVPEDMLRSILEQ